MYGDGAYDDDYIGYYQAMIVIFWRKFAAGMLCGGCASTGVRGEKLENV